MSEVSELLKPMDGYEKAAFYVYLFSPLLLIFLILIFVLTPGGALAALFTLPLFLGSSFILYQIFSGKFRNDSAYLLLSIIVIVYALFFPYILLISSTRLASYTFIYILFNLPLFLGHIYAMIYYITKSLEEQSGRLIVKEGNGSTDK